LKLLTIIGKGFELKNPKLNAPGFNIVKPKMPLNATSINNHK